LIPKKHFVLVMKCGKFVVLRLKTWKYALRLPKNFCFWSRVNTRSKRPLSGKCYKTKRIESLDRTMNIPGNAVKQLNQAGRKL
jgi:hypothetical protein